MPATSSTRLTSIAVNTSTRNATRHITTLLTTGVRNSTLSTTFFFSTFCLLLTLAYFILQEPNLDRTVAYPGSACPAGYTPACTTAFTLANSPTAHTTTIALTQTWCCPAATSLDRDWVCTDRDQQGIPTSRLCLGSVGAANVWLLSGTGYTTSSVPAEISIRALSAAFPLEAAAAAAKREADSNGHGGITAGIVVGSAGLFVFIGLGVYICLRVRKERREEEAKGKAEVDRDDGGREGGERRRGERAEMASESAAVELAS